MHQLKYRSDIDGLRAIAVLIVVAYHAFPALLPGGFIGVDVFFIISGYLITTIIFENLVHDTFSFTDFYYRRIRRIFPALLLVLVSGLTLGWFLFIPEDYAKLGKHTFGGAFFVSNLISLIEFGYFDVAAEFKPLLHLWSLGIEEQFYIVWPVIVVLAWRFKVDFRFIIAMGILGSVSLDFYKSGFDTTFAFFSPKTRAWELLLGAGLAYLSVFTKYDRLMHSLGVKQTFSLLGMSLLVFGTILIDSSFNYPGTAALLPTMGAVCLIAAGPSGFINRMILSNRVLTNIGLISYPLYLWHWLLLGVANVTSSSHNSAMLRSGIVVLSIFLAYSTYKFVEQPIRHSSSFRLSAYILVVSMFCVGTIGLTIFWRNGLYGQTKKPLLVSANAMDDCVLSFKAGRLCVMGNLEAKETVLVYGDSQAEQLSAAINESLGKKYKIIFAFYSSCFMDELQTLGLKTSPQCTSLIRLTKALKGQQISAVVRAQQWHGYGIESESQVIATVNEAIKAFDLAPQKVFIVGGVASVDIRCAKWNYYFSDKRTAKSCSDDRQSLQSVNSFMSITRRMQLRENVQFVHPYEKLCTAEGCHAIYNGIQYYSNENHLTKDGAKLVISDIVATLNPVSPNPIHR